jgi:hypothetical protein
MTPSEQREAFNELAKQPGILSGTQYAEMINARLAWSDGEEGTLKLIDDHRNCSLRRDRNRSLFALLRSS